VSLADQTYTFWSMDTPSGPILIAPCCHPESEAERPDVPTGLVCPDHARSVYLCVDLSMLWCDGGADAQGEFNHAHRLELVSGDDLD